MSNEPVKKTYVEFVYPGSFMCEYSTQEVPNRDEQPELPQGAFAFRFFDHETVEINGKEFYGKRSNISGLTYVDGEVLSVDDVKRSVPNNRALVSNMESNGWDYMVRTRAGNFQRLNEGDSVTKDGQVIYPNMTKYPTRQTQR